jgi:hypothetical protein
MFSVLEAERDQARETVAEQGVQLEITERANAGLLRDLDFAEARAAALTEERDRLKTALDWIEAEPEDPIKVQLWARAALGGALLDGKAEA